ncbi:hypothetical protein ZWY2020_003811 [Hordeum vulgare]|nr:hypothetical protein ZWY2020_003811 [Hordeum vulgare]
MPLPPRRRDEDRQNDGAGGFQEVRAVASILGGAQTPASNHAFKQFAREVNVALPKPEEMRPLNWSQTTITFDPTDQLSGAGLNVLSVETFETLQLPYEQLMPTKPFSGVTEGSTVPIGQVRLPVTFSERKNYHTKIIFFDVAHIHLSYNVILGYPALAKFMAVTHHGYNVLKMRGSGGVITIVCDKKDAVCTLERYYRAAAAECSNDKEDDPPREDPRKKKKQLLPMEHPRSSGFVPGDGVMPPIA